MEINNEDESLSEWKFFIMRKVNWEAVLVNEGITLISVDYLIKDTSIKHGNDGVEMCMTHG